MLTNELSRAALELPTADRLELARRLVESVVEPAPLSQAVSEGIRRIEDVVTGRVAGLTESQYRVADTMKVVFHPEFPRDQQKFEAGYAEISPGLADRFREEIDGAIEAIKASPGGAGHFVSTGSTVLAEFRRRNLRAFPFFVLYGSSKDTLIFGSIVPTRSDPLNWLTRFPAQHTIFP